MTNGIDYYIGEFEKLRIKNKRAKPGNSAYGSNVMSLLEMYKNLSSYDQRVFFREALEKYLSDPDEENRTFAITICLGFVVFHKSI